MMNKVSSTFWFLLSGLKEQPGKKTVFAVFAGAFSFVSDVLKLFSHEFLLWAGLFFALALALFGFIAASAGHPLVEHEARPESLFNRLKSVKTKQPLSQGLRLCRELTHFALIAALVLASVGEGQRIVSARNPAGALDASLFATLIPPLQKLQRELGVVHEDLTRIDNKLDNVKKETSADPRKELANLGISWTADAMLEAVRRGDRRTLELFIAGGMSASAPSSQGRYLPVELALNTENAAETLDVLTKGGLDINHGFEIYAPMGTQRMTLLSRAVEKGNAPLVQALVRHKVKVDAPIQTSGAMGMTRDTYPLAAAFYWNQIDIAEVLQRAGADASVGDYAAYREAQALRQKPSLTPEMSARLDSIIAQIKPRGDAAGRVEAERRLQEVERRLNQVALEGLRALRGSSEKTRLDREYDSLQIERTQLRKQLAEQSNE